MLETCQHACFCSDRFQVQHTLLTLQVGFANHKTRASDLLRDWRQMRQDRITCVHKWSYLKIDGLFHGSPIKVYDLGVTTPILGNLHTCPYMHLHLVVRRFNAMFAECFLIFDWSLERMQSDFQGLYKWVYHLIPFIIFIIMSRIQN